jgi:hypothetical protein
MVYRHSYGVIKQKLSIVGQLVIAGIFSLTASFAMFSRASAASVPVNYTTTQFTTSELGNWFTDRKTPSGGYNSLASYSGRSNVLEMRIDAQSQDPNAFYQTEGLQRTVPAGVIALKADLYIDSSWLNTNVRAGLWGVGQNASHAVSAYPIVEFTTAGDGGFIGWRTWDGVLGGWTNKPNVEFETNRWNRLEIIYNNTTHKFDTYINGDQIESNTADDSVDFSAVILNSKNYGSLGSNYSVHWSNFAYGKLQDKKSCKKDEWKESGFKNKGQCISNEKDDKDNR